MYADKEECIKNFDEIFVSLSVWGRVSDSVFASDTDNKSQFQLKHDLEPNKAL